MNFNVGCATDVGRKRSQNQDSIKSSPELGLFIVADGMGGHRGGETASLMVIELVPELDRRAQAAAGDRWNPKTVISQAIASASNTIHLRATKEPGLQGMGTTAVALLFKDGLLTIGHV